MTRRTTSMIDGELVPVNLDPIRIIERSYDATAHNATEIAHALRNLIARTDPSLWSGSAADEFARHCDELPKLVDKVSQSYRDAAFALSGLAREVVELEPRSKAAIGALASQRVVAAAAHDTVLAAPGDPMAIEADQAAQAGLIRSEYAAVAIHNEYLLAEARCVNALELARSEAIPPLKWWQNAIRIAGHIVSIAIKIVAVVATVFAVVCVIALACANPTVLLLLAAAQGAVLSTTTTAATALGLAYLSLRVLDRTTINDKQSPKFGQLVTEAVFSFGPTIAGKALLRNGGGVVARLNIARTGMRLQRTATPMVALRYSATAVATPGERYITLAALSGMPTRALRALKIQDDFEAVVSRDLPHAIANLIRQHRDVVVIIATSIGATSVSGFCVAIPERKRSHHDRKHVLDWVARRLAQDRVRPRVPTAGARDTLRHRGGDTGTRAKVQRAANSPR